jgi:hypothetical protein
MVSVTLSDNMTSIAASTFSGCSSLTGKLTIPKKIKTIGLGAFRNTNFTICELTGESVIDLPDSYIDYEASKEEVKSSLGNIRTVIVPSALASAYRESAWGDAYEIVSNSGIEATVNITIPGNLARDIVEQTRKAPASVNKLIITSGEMNEDDFRVIKDNMTACFDLDLTGAVCEAIPENALGGKEVLQSIVLPAGATAIGKCAFADCLTLESVSLPGDGNLQIIGENAFKGCNALKTVELGDKLTEIGDYAFCNNYSLSQFSMPNSTAKIGDGAFENAMVLSTIKLGESIGNIGASTFSGCASLSEIVIPGSVTAIGESAFASCRSLSEIAIPSSVASIGASAFSNSGVVSVDLSELNEMTAIEAETFSGCAKLENVAFPKNITSVGDKAFYECTSLTDADMSETKIAEVGANAFNGCTKLASIFLPSTTKALGESAFSGCRKLQTISITATTPPTVQSTTFKSVPNETCSLLIPTNSFYDYLLASYWGSFVDIKASFDIAIEGDEAGLDYEVFDSEEEANEDILADNSDNENGDNTDNGDENVDNGSEDLDNTDNGDARRSNHTRAKAKSSNLSNGISLFVPTSKTVRFHVTGDMASGEVSVLLNDEDVTDRLVNGYLILSNFGDVNTIKIKSPESGIKDVTAPTDSEINANTIVEVYNLSGVAVMRGVEMGSIGNLSTGIYIVRSANATKKIVIK